MVPLRLKTGLMTGLLTCIVALSQGIAAELETVNGNACYKYGDNETHIAARSMAIELAKRRAIESYGVFVVSASQMEDFTLKKDLVTSLAGAYLRDVTVTRDTEKGREICVWVEARLDPGEVDELVENKMAAYELQFPTSDSTEKVGEGVINWDKKTIRAKGFGGANKSFPRHVWQKSAEEAARMDAQARLLEMSDGLKIESTTFFRNYQTILDRKVKEVKGELGRTRQVGKTMYPTADTAEVVMEVNLQDVLD